MWRILMYIGTFLELLLGVLLLIVGVYNVVVDIQQGSFFALPWLLPCVLGGWFIDLSLKEFKKVKEGEI